MTAMDMDLNEMARAIGGELRNGAVRCSGVSTDSRRIGSGELFIALRGERFDGHDFLEQVRERGACGVMVDGTSAVQLPQLVVDDTRLGLGRLAAAWRSRFAIPLVAVTGSNGKTTVKEMTTRILAAHYGEVLATEGNLNNDIGVPQTLLRLRPHHRAAVIEMGANHHGEIDYLTHLARPTVAVVTNAGQAHLEGFGSVEGVARAKGEVYGGLGESGVAVVNADDTYADYWRRLNTPRRVMTFGIECAADVSAGITASGAVQSLMITTPTGEVAVQLPLPGRHNALNALAATAAALAAGVGLAAVKLGLEAMVPVKGRLRMRPGRAGAVVIDDTYNANPSSLAVGLEVLMAQAGRRVLVLGDMGELGTGAEAMHAEMGALARRMGVDALYCVGELSRAAAASFGAAAHSFTDKESLIGTVAEQMGEDLTILVKGSRRMRMEEVVNALTTDGEVKQ